VSRLYRVDGAAEITRRRSQLGASGVIEAWVDLYAPGRFWLGEESKALLDSVGEPMPAELALPAEAVPVYYGPRLTDLDSLPPENSLKARVLSAHGIAAAWITLDRFGERTSYQPQAPTDPIFHLRRRGGGTGHVWRLFTTRKEAVVYLGEFFGRDSEAGEWAAGLVVEHFAALLERHTLDR
jgi:hypothetical protein